MSIDTDTFVTSMRQHWETALGNISSPALEAVWSQMCETFNEQIASSSSIREQVWRVLQPPTGTGKTQGLALYCSLLAKQDGVKVGGLIVTRLIKQADDLATQINELAGRQNAALACHSDSRPDEFQVDDTQFLVITHAAYENALRCKSINNSSFAMDRYAFWEGGRRELVVIDEALDVVRMSDASLYDVNKLLGLIPPSVAASFPEEMEAIAFVKEVLEALMSEAEQLKEQGTRMREKIVRRYPETRWCGLDFTALRRRCRQLAWDQLIDQRTDQRLKRNHRTFIDNVLGSIQSTIQNWHWYYLKGASHRLSTASFIIPDEIEGAVIMDATAEDNLLYDLFEGKVERLPAPENARYYGNVRLHVGRTSLGMGKRTMSEHGKELIAGLLPSVSKVLEESDWRSPTNRRVFVCTHKDVEPTFRGLDHPFQYLGTGHWNAIDGRNDWSNHDTAVVLGLPYRGPAWSANTYMAVQGVQDDTWLNHSDHRKFGKHPDIRKALGDHQMVVSIVQAINRVRCRRVIDAEGNCEQTDVFIVVPDNKLGSFLVDGIERNMPGIEVLDWDFKTPARPRLVRSNKLEALEGFAEAMSPGRIAVSAVKKALNISSSQWDRFASALRDEASEVFKRISEHSVSYLVTGSGNNRRAYLVKG